MDVHEGLDTGAVEGPRVDHRVFLELVLGVDLVNHLKNELFHHEGARLGQVDSLIELHALSLLRLPDLLRNRLAQTCVHFYVGELQFLVQLVEVLVVDDHEHVALGEDALLELVIELLLLST